MSEFKVGDRVRATETVFEYRIPKGTLGTVMHTGVGDDRPPYSFWDELAVLWDEVFDPENLYASDETWPMRHNEVEKI